MYFNGAATAGLTIALTGTVAAGDVFVLAHSASARRDPRPGRPDQRRRAGSTATTRSCCARRRRPVDRLDRPGRRRPRHRVGHRADQHRRQHAAPQGRPSRPATPTRPTRSTRPPSGTASPPTPSTGSARTPRRRRPGDQPAVLTCGAALVTAAGTAATRTVTATDPDDTIVDLAVTAVSPAPGGRLDHPYRLHPGDRRRRHRDAPTVTASADVPAGALRGDRDLDRRRRHDRDLRAHRAGRRRCCTVGEVQGPTARRRERQDRPVAAGAGDRQRHQSARCTTCAA